MTEIEQVLIARLLVEPDQIPSLAGTLGSSDFTHRASGRAWALMQQLVAAGRPVDIAVLRAEGADPGEPTQVLTSAHTAPVAEYARLIRESAYKRRVEQSLEMASARVQRVDDPTEILGVVQSLVNEVSEGVPQRARWTSIVDVSMADFEASGLTYGIPRLDEAIQPAHAGNMVTVAARANVGKSVFSLNVAEHWARTSKLPILFASQEMTEKEIKKRFLKHVPIADLPLYERLILVDKARTTTAIRGLAKELCLRFGGIGGICVDYLQRVADKGEVQHERVARISSAMKDLASEFDCPVLVPAQLNRQSEGMKPRLQDLAQSGAIEQDSDVVLGLYRTNKDTPWMEVLCLKNRHGSAGWSVRLDFDLERVAVRGE